MCIFSWVVSFHIHRSLGRPRLVNLGRPEDSLVHALVRPVELGGARGPHDLLESDPALAGVGEAGRRTLAHGHLASFASVARPVLPDVLRRDVHGPRLDGKFAGCLRKGVLDGLLVVSALRIRRDRVAPGSWPRLVGRPREPLQHVGGPALVRGASEDAGRPEHPLFGAHDVLPGPHGQSKPNPLAEPVLEVPHALPRPGDFEHHGLPEWHEGAVRRLAFHLPKGRPTARHHPAPRDEVRRVPHHPRHHRVLERHRRLGPLGERRPQRADEALHLPDRALDASVAVGVPHAGVVVAGRSIASLVSNSSPQVHDRRLGVGLQDDPRVRHSYCGQVARQHTWKPWIRGDPLGRHGVGPDRVAQGLEHDEYGQAHPRRTVRLKLVFLFDDLGLEKRIVHVRARHDGHALVSWDRPRVGSHCSTPDAVLAP